MNGEELTFHGKHFTIEKARIRPKPSQAIPIIVGGRSNAALRRAATYADGWIGVWCSAKRYAEATGLIDEYAQAANRTAPQWLHGYQPWIGVDADPVKAREVVKQAMEKFYHVPFEQFERYIDSGCRLFNLKVCTQAPEEEVDLGGEVLSALSKMRQDQT